MTARLRRDEGHTLPELLTALTMAMVILLATFALLDHVMDRTAETQARVEATQKGRQAMDTITRAVRSTVCLSPTVPAISQAKADSVTFYADLGDGTVPPVRQTVAYDAGTRRITQDVYPGTGMPPATTFAASPAYTKTLAENVVPDGSTPVFRFFAYDTATPATASLALPGSVALADLGRIARVSVTYVARAGSAAGGSATRAAVTYTDDVFFRSADPNDPAPYPTCA
jgi:type II secretory pathway pseudopilin PulG